MAEIELGHMVRDQATGFKGRAVARYEYLAGCIRICVQPLAEEGKLPRSQVFDEPLLEVIEVEGAPALTLENDDPGGPLPYEPTRRWEP